MGFLKGKTAIITGAGYAVLEDGRCGSIGYGIATAYAKEGANLVITGRNVQKLEDAKKALEEAYGIQVLVVPADVNDKSDNDFLLYHDFIFKFFAVKKAFDVAESYFRNASECFVGQERLMRGHKHVWHHNKP